MKICVIGCGVHSGFFHGPSLKRIAGLRPDTILAACCDLKRELTEQYASSHGFRRSYTDYLEMLDAERPDMVDVVMPVHLTEKVALEVLSRGVSCILEKPPAESPEGVRRIIAEAAGAGAQARVAFNRRFAPLTGELVRRLAEMPEDRIQLIAYDMHRYQRGGEDFAFTALHGIDLVRYVAGADYADVRYDYEPVAENTVNIYMHGTMTNGISVRLNVLPHTGRSLERLAVHTGERSFFLDIPVNRDDCGALTVFRNNKLLQTVRAAKMEDVEVDFVQNGVFDELSSFIELLRNRDTDTTSAIGQSLQSVEMACLIRNKASFYRREE